MLLLCAFCTSFRNMYFLSHRRSGFITRMSFQPLERKGTLHKDNLKKYENSGKHIFVTWQSKNRLSQLQKLELHVCQQPKNSEGADQILTWTVPAAKRTENISQDQLCLSGSRFCSWTWIGEHVCECQQTQISHSFWVHWRNSLPRCMQAGRRDPADQWPEQQHDLGEHYCPQGQLWAAQRT